MTEHYPYAPVERVVLTAAEFAALRDTAANLEAALLANQEEQAQLRAERDELAAVLAAVPVAEIRRWLEHSNVWHANRRGQYSEAIARTDGKRIDAWLAQQSEVTE